MVPLVVRVDNLDARTTTQFAFIKSPVRIGRSELNDLPLMEGFVSQWHGVIQFDENQMRYVDLGSTNGTHANGVKLEKNVPVEVDATTELRIGSLRFMLARRAVTQRTVAPRPPTQFALHASGLTTPGQQERAPAAPTEQAPPPAPLPPPEIDAAEQAVGSAADQLATEYAAYQEAWQRLNDTMQGLVSEMDGEARDRAADLLRERYPVLGAETAAAPPSAEEPAEPSSGLGATALRLIRAFAESYVPMAPAIANPKQLESFLGRIAEVVESYSKSFVELRKGYEEFGKEMGIRTVHGTTPIHRARDHRQVLAYLLESRDDGQRIQELQGAFADLMMHHVALLNGIMEGARGMLGQISPETIELAAGKAPVAIWPPSAWPFGKSRLWHTFTVRHHEIADEESSVSQVFFGKEFARAYSAVVGQRDADESGQRKSPPRASAGPRTSHGR